MVAQKRTHGVVFMAWGTPAGKNVQKVDRKRHLVLQSVHPSPLSAHKGYWDCGHFKKANEWLVERYGEDADIDWGLSPNVSTKKDPAAPGEKEKEKAKAEAMAAEEEGKKKAAPAKVKIEESFGSDDEDALEEAMRLADKKEK